MSSRDIDVILELKRKRKVLKTKTCSLLEQKTKIMLGCQDYWRVGNGKGCIGENEELMSLRENDEMKSLKDWENDELRYLRNERQELKGYMKEWEKKLDAFMKLDAKNELSNPI
ncbi:hypothetical protein SLEP1_g15050 [Rubroshorea leprosula]|uniref:Uncharacterized protein n=1 Tax=Rubroshorea leprosula TaxID=152421 RepID=A0AAV5IL54_9ROSI|nr:hypothetical protein SLEP1_g15050 [Rubroshorea leprosula]